MTADSTRAHIEADIAEERNALAESISELTDRFSPEKLIGSLSDTFKSQGDDLAHTVARGARENPAALALIGAGIGWLLLSQSRSRTPDRPGAPVAYDTRSTTPVHGLRNGVPSQEEAEFKARVAAAEASLREPHESDDPSLFDQAKRFVRRTAADMRATLYDGTSELSDMARARVVDARRKAIAAQDRVEHHARRAKGKGGSFYEKNPLVVGGAVAALGAAAAFALPRTRFEDDTFGAHRDALVSEADRALHEELARVKAMATAAADEAGDIAREKVDAVPSGDEVVDRAEAEVRSAGERIADRAREAKAH
jgi:hypothetical protein